jgi:hypothetical protein
MNSAKADVAYVASRPLYTYAYLPVSSDKAASCVVASLCRRCSPGVSAYNGTPAAPGTCAIAESACNGTSAAHGTCAIAESVYNGTPSAYNGTLVAHGTCATSASNGADGTPAAHGTCSTSASNDTRSASNGTAASLPRLRLAHKS